MHTATVAFAVFAGLTAGWATDAQVKSDNPPGVQFCVRMTPDQYNGMDLAAVAETGDDGYTHITFNVNGAEYPPSDGPFLYHIHQKKVSSGTDCAAAGGHLDPYNRGETPECNSAQPQTCQVGDLSGKHGDIQSLPGFSQTYADKYLSLKQDDGSFLGDKSLVLHFFNTTSFACANWGPCQVADTSPSATAVNTITAPVDVAAPSMTTVTSTLASGQMNGKTITITKTVSGGSSNTTLAGLTTITSTVTSGLSSGDVVTVTTTVWNSGPTSPTAPAEVTTSANGRLTTVTLTSSAQVTATYVSTLPGPTLTTVTSTFLTVTAVQLVTTYTSTLSGPPATDSLTTVTSTSLPSQTTITTTLTTGDSSGSTTTITSTLSYTTVTSTVSNGNTTTTTYTSQITDHGFLGFSISIGRPFDGTQSDSTSTSTTTMTETNVAAGLPTARGAQAFGALVIALAAAVA